MAFVHFGVQCDPSSDQMRWLSARLLQYAKELNVILKGEHTLELFRAPASIDDRWRLRCSCGWDRRIHVREPATTGTPALHIALKEHVLSFTDPSHYTYYPQGV